MAWRFRQSFSLIPGLRLNLSKSGLSASIGGAPFTMNVGPRGVYGTVSLPGTGISYRRSLFSESPSASHHAVPTFETVRAAPVQEIHSASTEALTSESLQELKRLIQITEKQRAEISTDLAIAEADNSRLCNKYLSWAKGFLVKRIFNETFAKHKANADSATARVQELQEQLRLTTIATHFEIDKEQAEPYFRMRDEFAALTGCGAIWGIDRQQLTDRFRERTTAFSKVDRKPVPFTLDHCDLIQWEQKVPHLTSANGGDLYMYPGFFIYRAAKEAFSVISTHEVNATATLVEFQENEGVPADSNIIGQAWAKENKDGSRDRRFANNYQIPVAHYARLSLKTAGGLWEEFLFSAPDRLKRFMEAWVAFEASFQVDTSSISN